jgi:thymidylate kinase
VRASARRAGPSVERDVGPVESRSVGPHGAGRGFTVALVGPDGAGKSTVGRLLPELLEVPARYIYMGINLEASNLLLPTTRWYLRLKRWRGGRPDLAPPRLGAVQTEASKRSAARRWGGWVRQVFRTANLIAEEWYRQAVVWRHQGRGEVVVLDRHFLFDYYDHDVAPAGSLPLARRFHGFLLRHLYPRPELLIVLDAPGEVLFARKGESTPQALDERRRSYLRLRDQVRHSAVVDAGQPVDRVVREVSDLVQAHALRSR